MSDTIHIHIERECPVRVITVEPTGARGAAGTAATVAVGTTTTGAAGSSASVTNSGTTSAAVLNFTIPQGATGANGGSSTAWRYRAKTNATSGYPTNGHLIWNNATQLSATEILVSHLNDDGSDIELFLSFFVEGQKLFIQNRDDSSQNQIWEITGTPTVTNQNTSTSYYTFPVTLVSSQGAEFNNNHSILFGTITEATNSVTSATTSDGTANLSLGDLEVVGGEIYTDGEYSSIYTQGATAHIFTLGSGAEIYTEGELAQIYTTGASAQIYTAGAGATIGTQGANATIYTLGTNATISTAGSAAHIQTSHASAAVKSTNFAAVESGGASLVDGSMQPCLTWSAGGRNLTIPSGTATTFNTTSYTYGTGAAAAHRDALDITSADLQIESLFTLLTRQESDAGVFTANAGTATSSQDGDSLSLSATTANQRPNVYRFRNWNRNPGVSGTANAVTPVRLACAGNIYHLGSGANGASFRCGFGMVNGASAVAANANATTGRGFGWRIAWNSSTSKLEFNLWAHDGTTYVEGTGIDTGLGAGNLDGFFNIILRLASDGTVSANTWFGSSTSSSSVPSATPSVTLAGGPTSGSFANLGTPSWIAAAHSTNAPASGNSIIARISNRKLALG